MAVSLPPDKLANVQQLALSLLQAHHVMVCQVKSFLGKAKFFPGWPAGYCVRLTGTALLPAYIATHLSVEADYVSWVGSF